MGHSVFCHWFCMYFSLKYINFLLRWNLGNICFYLLSNLAFLGNQILKARIFLYGMFLVNESTSTSYEITLTLILSCVSQVYGTRYFCVQIWRSSFWYRLPICSPSLRVFPDQRRWEFFFKGLSPSRTLFYVAKINQNKCYYLWCAVIAHDMYEIPWPLPFYILFFRTSQSLK